MITHIFYHQETVESQCAINSWESIRDWFGKDDEVIILDLGGTLACNLLPTVTPKFFRIERIRTDTPEERSYTFGLNYIVPQAKFEWVCIWRSDYIYNQRYYGALLAGMKEGNVVLPYEAFIGGAYCTPDWCRDNLDMLIHGGEEFLLANSTVCPTYEVMDFPHFAIQKSLWTGSGGMDGRLWGYGWQFPEFFLRLKKRSDYAPSVQFDLTAFHQTHESSFGMGLLTADQQEEKRQSETKLLHVFGSIAAVENFKKEISQKPLRPRRAAKDYELKNREPYPNRPWEIIREGSLVFDVGANKGEKAIDFIAKGARVVCFEPQPHCIESLRQRFAASGNVTIVGKGLAARPGTMTMSICSNADTISTFSTEWKSGRFSEYSWDSEVSVPVSTLDEEVRAYGIPEYCKIDVEGYEYEVLSGLSLPIPFISFEFTKEFLTNAERCLQHLESIGYDKFNVVLGESKEFFLDAWQPSSCLMQRLNQMEDPLLWGDIYAAYPSAPINTAGGVNSPGTCYSPRPAPGVHQTIPSPSEKNALSAPISAPLWKEGQPLRLHLGCGQHYLEGYVNIDYPPEAHNVMSVRADVYADLLELSFPFESVDEIRLHHVFEHFNRITALGLLIRWYKWLKPGGKIHIETPDLLGSARTMLSEASLKVKMGVARHLAGDQAAQWGYHIDHWFPERFRHTFEALGFNVVETRQESWPEEPYLSNVHAVGIKSRQLTDEQLLQAADALLWQSTVADAEMPTFTIWRAQLRDFLSTGLLTTMQVPQCHHDAALFRDASALPLNEIHTFNQRNRDLWVRRKAAQTPAGSKVLDVGAGTCPYRTLFSHCDYKAHDFKKYSGEKLGGSTEYGAIDYISDITAIPVSDAFFDVVLCTEVLEHVPNPDAALREMARILKPGGKLYVTAPLGSGLHQLPFHYYGGFSPEWYRHFAAQNGLEAVEITPNGGFFKLLAQECIRAAGLIAENRLASNDDLESVRALFTETLPRYLFSLEDKCFIDQFTIGYHVELAKRHDSQMHTSSKFDQLMAIKASLWGTPRD